jgi:spore coat protein U-like protein
MAQVAGVIDATITLTAACEVNGSPTSADLGTLAFGTHTTLFDSASAEVNGTGAIGVRCTPGATATLTFGDGENDGAVAGSGRALANAGGTLFVPYDIYSDAGLSDVLAPTDQITIPGTGEVETVHVYGKALGAPDLTPGTYADTIAITLTF